MRCRTLRHLDGGRCAVDHQPAAVPSVAIELLELVAAAAGGRGHRRGSRCSISSPAAARLSPGPPHWTMLWLVFVNAGTISTYIAAARGGPAHDAELSGDRRRARLRLGRLVPLSGTSPRPAI